MDTKDLPFPHTAPGFEAETIKVPGDVALKINAQFIEWSTLVDNWTETARFHAKNEEYYRGLVQEIGAMFGDEAFISDDGSVQQDILCAKVPELVRAHMENGRTSETESI